ncbi:MAG: DUF1778 domain-containing protein [Nitrospiraceae bacterium]|nr:DUF1778 domain-containing protein [Nitrospiraceae bacterium]
MSVHCLDARLDLRLSSATKRTLKSAAAVSRRSLTDFILESALSRTDETLTDRRTFVLSKANWSAFQAALDAPICPLPRMQRLLSKPGFFDVDSSD